MVKLLRLALALCAIATPCHSFQSSNLHPLVRNPTTSPHPKNSIQRTSVASSTRLEAASLLASAGSPIGSFLVLTGIIVVHECGHYLAARNFGVKVEEFAIGFGPKLFGFEALGNEFNFRAFPLGGYVRFPENYNITLVQEQQRQLRKEYREWVKLAPKEEIMDNNLEYQLANALTLGSMEKKRLKDQEAMSKLQQETKSQPFWKSLYGAKETTAKPVVPPKPQNPDDVEIEYFDDPDLLQNRPWTERAVVLSGGVIFNLLLAFAIYFGEISTTGLPQPVFDRGILVSQNPIQEGAANGILKKGDVVVGVNGKAVAMSQSPSAIDAQDAISDFIKAIRATPDGESLSVSVLRGNKPVDVSLQPKNNNGAKSIGVMLSPNFVRTELIKADNPIQAVAPAAKIVTTMTKETAAGLSKFFATLISGKDTAGQQISGPIGLIKTGSDIVSTNNWSTVLAFAAAVSINLGVANALPLPALDGGQLVFVAIEAATGRKVDQRVQEEVIGVTVLFLILLSASAAFGDVQNIIMKK